LLTPVNSKILLDTNLHAIIIDGMEPRFLPEKEYKLLMFFLDNKKRVLTTEIILATIWDEFTDKNIVSQYVFRLRVKLDDRKKNIITHRHGIGYILMA
jgi:DNA-binding response OmpR family regulator